MTGPIYEHGTHARYALGSGDEPPCRCLRCRVAHSNYNTHLTRQKAYGRAPLVDAEPVREHIRALSAQGLGWKRVAARSGVAQSTVCKLLFGHPSGGKAPSSRVRRRTAEAILDVQVTLDDLAPKAVVPAVATQRRLQALVAIGWSQTELAGRIGVTLQNFARPLQDADQVTAATARTVRGVYAQLWDQHPPERTPAERGTARRSRNYASARGWAVPMAWDDDTIDDPDARPELGEPAAARGIDLAEVEHLADHGAHITEIARRVRVSVSAIEQAQRRARAS